MATGNFIFHFRKKKKTFFLQIFSYQKKKKEKKRKKRPPDWPQYRPPATPETEFVRTWPDETTRIGLRRVPPGWVLEWLLVIVKIVGYDLDPYLV